MLRAPHSAHVRTHYSEIQSEPARAQDRQSDRAAVPRQHATSLQRCARTRGSMRFIYLDEAGISNPANEPYLVVADADHQWMAVEPHLHVLAETCAAPARRQNSFSTLSPAANIASAPCAHSNVNQASFVWLRACDYIRHAAGDLQYFRALGKSLRRNMFQTTSARNSALCRIRQGFRRTCRALVLCLRANAAKYCCIPRRQFRYCPNRHAARRLYCVQRRARKG